MRFSAEDQNLGLRRHANATHGIDYGNVGYVKPKNNRAGETDLYDLLRLDNQLCFALYAATRALSRTYREKLSPMGITYPQYLVLIVLWEQDKLTLTEIGRRLMLDSGTLTPLIKRMESMGIVERNRNRADEREVVVQLSAKGHELKDKALDARHYVACRLGMSEEEIMALRSDLMGMIDQLNEGCSPDKS